MLFRSLDVFIVDGDALQPIDFLDLVDEVLLQFLRAADVENLVRVDRAFGELLPFLDVIALEDDDMSADRNEVFLLHGGLLVLDEDTALAAHTGPEVHDALDLRSNKRMAGPSGLKKF